MFLVIPAKNDSCSCVLPDRFQPRRPRIDAIETNVFWLAEMGLIGADAANRAIAGGIHQIELAIPPERRAVGIDLSRHVELRGATDARVLRKSHLAGENQTNKYAAALHISIDARATTAVTVPRELKCTVR